VKELPKNVSASFKARNPQLYPVGRLQNSQPKSTTPQALARFTEEQQRRAQSLGVCISIITLRRRLLDSDNLVGSCKPLRDAIARSIGLDDGDKRLRWQYEQFETKGRQGTIVRIELI
jgi:hypothetical protein